MSSLPPGPSAPRVVQTLEWVRRPAEMLERCRRNYGPSFTLRIAPEDFVVLSDPEDLRRLFAAKPGELETGAISRRVARVLVGDRSIILLDGPEHLRRRRQLMPAFHGERVRNYGEVMAEVTRRTVERFPTDRAFALHPPMQDITLEVIVRTVFGADAGEETRQLVTDLRHLLKMGELPGALLPILYLSDHPEVESRPPWCWLLAGRDRAHRIVQHLIERRRRDSERAAGPRRLDVLTMLLESRDEQGRPMSDEELRDELMTTLAAGHESTATSLAWCFERLLSEPRVQRRLRADLAQAGGGDASPDAIAALPYLDATIKETLRLRPVLPFVARRLRVPMRLGGHELPAGTTVGGCIYLAQRDPHYYPQPQSFRPERFLDITPEPSCWLPFGGGSRRCVGVPFALYEMKVVLAHVLARCELELASSAPIKPVRRSITLWPQGGTRVRLRKALA